MRISVPQEGGSGMNKFIRGCLYVAGIMAAVGLVFFVLGTVFGGLRQTINIGRNGGFNRVILSPFEWYVSVDNDGINIEDWSFGNCETDMEAIDDEDLIDYEKEDLGTTDDIDAIEINLKAGELNIRESEDNMYRLEANQVYQMKCYMRGSILYVRSVGVKSDCTEIKKQKVTLYVPKNAGLQEVDIELGAGQGKIEQLQAEELSVEVGAGELRGTGIQADQAYIQVGAGMVDLKDCVLEDTEYEVGLGSLCYQGRLSGNTDVSCNMGSVEMQLDGQEEDYNYRIECAMGSVNIGDRHFSGMSGNKRLDNGADSMMNIDCAMGNITVQFEK